MDNIDAFLNRCDRLMERRAQLGRPLSEARLSTILFSSGPRLARLRLKRRIFHDTLAAAEQVLAEQEAKLAEQVAALQRLELAARHSCGRDAEQSVMAQSKEGGAA